MYASRSLFFLSLILSANVDTATSRRSFLGQQVQRARKLQGERQLALKLQDVTRHTMSSNTSLATNVKNETQILCFGLCIAALGGVGLFFLIGAGSVTTVGIGYAAKMVIDHLDEAGVTSEQIRQVVSDAALFATVSNLQPLTQEERMHREAVTPVSWAPVDLLGHIGSSCGDFMEAKGLGESASSSKSGAVFFNCKSAAPSDDYPRMLVKGAIRDSDSSPEWQNVQELAQSDGLLERYSNPTLLNKMVLAFDAYGLHWIVLEDVKATRAIHLLQNKLKITILELEMPEFDAFDIKPSGSRAPQLPGCLQRLDQLSKDMGPIHEFKGWDRIASTLELDLAFLKNHHIIDESLFVQVAGPFDVDANTVDSAGEDAILEVLAGTPMCAYQVKDGKMALVCLSILDYVLSMSFMKSVQNVFQFSRWNHYERKMATLLSCLGDLHQTEKCAMFESMAAGKWLELVTAAYAEQSTQDLKSMNYLESNYRCCCNTAETKDTLTMETACAWLSRKDQTTAMGFCPGSLQHYSAASGGCLDLEPPRLPPPPPSTRCAFYQSCCCYDRDYKDGLTVDANALCSCAYSCPGVHNSYDPKSFCPATFALK